MIPTIIGLVALVLIPALMVWLLKTAAENKQQASNTAQGTVEFVVAGKRPIRLLENVRGLYWCAKQKPYRTKIGKPELGPDGKPNGEWEMVNVEMLVARALVPGDPKYEPRGYKKIRHYLRSQWGFYWVSLFYPLRKVYHFKLPKVRLRSGYQSGHPLEEWIERDREMAEVLALQYKVPRPVVVNDIEFQGAIPASVGVMTGLRFVIPEISVFTYPGEFYQMYEEAIKGAVIDYARKSTLDHFISMMAKGPNSDFFASVLSQLNTQIPPGAKIVTAPDGVEVYELPKDSPGLISQLGMEIEFGYISTVFQKESDSQKAIKQKEINRLNGEAEIEKQRLAADALRQKGKGDGDYKKLVADGETYAIQKTGEARADVLGKMVEKTKSPDVVIAELRRVGLESTNLGTLVESGTATGVMVNTGEGWQRTQPPAADQASSNQQGAQQGRGNRGGQQTPPANPPPQPPAPTPPNPNQGQQGP